MHGRLRFGYRLEQYQWDQIKESWARIDFDPYEPDWRDK
jgi:hypothetical protein